MSEKLTQEQLKELLHYDPEMGIFTWLVFRGRKAKPGQIAGSAKTDGYNRIIIGGKSYLASRLAWFYMEGYFPEHQMDHINRVRGDDRWKNLRHVSRQCNSRTGKP